MTTPTINERVTRGAVILDAKKPGWEREIDLASLELSDSCHCILGQLYGHYCDGVDILETVDGKWTGVEVATAGFITYPSEHISAYAKLDEAWISLIKERFDTGALSDA